MQAELVARTWISGILHSAFRNLTSAFALLDLPEGRL